jgi:hypothetical protein
LGVGEGAEAIIILLTGGIPKSKICDFTIDHNVRGVVIEDGGDVLALQESVSEKQLKLVISRNEKNLPKQKSIN